MSGKIFKYTSVFFLWLGVLALSGHLLLPHDHHITDTVSNQDEKCPASNNKSDHRSAFPVHCHALNELAIVKARPIQILRNIQFSFIPFSILTDASDFTLQVSSISLIDFSRPIFNSFAPSLSCLRAPPAFS